MNNNFNYNIYVEANYFMILIYDFNTKVIVTGS